MPVRDFTEFMDFGLGIDDLNGKIRGLAVSSGPAQPIPNNVGQKTQFRFHLAQSVEDLRTSLGLSVDATAQYGLFGGSDKFSFAQSCHFHSFSVFLLVHINVQNPSTHILGEQLVPAANSLLANNDTARFREEFGDLYIKGIELGGEYFAVVEIKTTDESDKTTISNSLSAAGFIGSGAASLATTFASNFEKTVQGHDHKVTAFQIGGKGAGQKQSIEVAEIINKALNFPTEVLAAPVPYRVELQDYLSLNLPKPPNEADLQKGREVMASLARQHAICLALLADVAYIQDPQTTDQFEAFDNATLTSVASQATLALNDITNAASKCLNDIHSCAFIAPTIPTTNLLPKRKKAVVPPVVIPDWVGADFLPLFADRDHLVTPADLQLRVKWEIVVGEGSFTRAVIVVETIPAAGSSVQPGSVVIIRTPTDRAESMFMGKQIFHMEPSGDGGNPVRVQDIPVGTVLGPQNPEITKGFTRTMFV